jgi:hypothetical protein
MSAGESQPMIDRCLVWCLWGFALVALVFEPTVYFGCLSSDGASVVADWRISHCEEGWIDNMWRVYADWDPLFIRVPPFLRIMCTIEVFVFGPCYVICALGLSQRPPPMWLPGFALLFSGALLYSTSVFFLYEYLFAPSAFVNLPMLALVHGPWTIVPCVLAWRCISFIRHAQTLGPTSPRGVIGCFNTDKWS